MLAGLGNAEEPLEPAVTESRESRLPRVGLRAEGEKGAITVVGRLRHQSERLGSDVTVLHGRKGELRPSHAATLIYRRIEDRKRPAPGHLTAAVAFPIIAAIERFRVLER